METINFILIDPELKSRPINFEQSLINKLSEHLEKEKDEIFMSKLKESGVLSPLEFDYLEMIESQRRFKSFLKEIRGNEETIYFNDGSLTGLRIVTFIHKETLSINENKIFCELSYY